jgi:hypothetical protein
MVTKLGGLARISQTGAYINNLLYRRSLDATEMQQNAIAHKTSDVLHKALHCVTDVVIGPNPVAATYFLSVHRF